MNERGKLENFRSARVVEVVVVEVLEGQGTLDDVFRIITYYLDREGTVLAKRDPLLEEESAIGGEPS